MSGDTEDRLFGLMEIAQGHQTAVQAALDGLAAERVALRKERETLAWEVRALERSMDTTVREAVKASLAGAATEGAAAVQAATQPLLGRLAAVTEGAGRAEAAMRQVVLWASWKLLGWIMAAAAGLVLLGWLASTLVLWWDTGTIAAAQLQKAQLQAQVAELVANHEGWLKAGMLGRIEHCGPKALPCIRVDEAAGGFESQGHVDYRVIQGY
jgi:hypothetical protein